MKVTDKMSMADYDTYTREYLPAKIPDLTSEDWRRHRGDSIYDFSASRVIQRPGPHSRGNISTDLSGMYVLLSTEFLYFGANAIALPEHLLAIAQNRQGHRSTLNQPYLTHFLDWIEGLNCSAGSVLGEPLMSETDELTKRWCSTCRADGDEQDEEECKVDVVRVTCRN